MEENATNNLEYILQVKKQYQDYLGQIYHWPKLKIAADEEYYWLKGFSFEEINSLEIQTVPFKKVFYLKEQKLFFLNSLLPIQKMPSFLWTPLAKGLPLELSKPNHNYFGINEKLTLLLYSSDAEKQPFGLCTDLIKLEYCLQSMAAIRLKNLQWLIINNTQALILGEPLLPIPGETYWRQNNFLIPTGYDFNWQIPLNIASHNDWVIWTKEAEYFCISKESFKVLSLSSLRLSIRK